MDVLGVYCFGQHDSSAALLQDGRVLAACEEERFTRKKFDNCFPAESMAFCLGQGSIEARDLDAVAFGWNPRLHRLDKALHILKHFPRSLRVLTRSGPRHLRLDSFARHFSNRTNFRGPVHLVNHHLAHAASVFFLSPFEEAAILTIDGVGEWETVWMGRGRGLQLEKTRSQGWPHSLGNVCTSVTQYLGFQMYSDEYKVMGLAPYGRPIYLDLFRKITPLTDRGFDVDTSYFGYHIGKNLTYSKKFIRELGPPREPEGEILPRHQDIAASLQARTEEIFVHLAREALQHTKTKYLCLAGGVALNSVAVGKIIELGLAEEVYVPPCAGMRGSPSGRPSTLPTTSVARNDKNLFWTPVWARSGRTRLSGKRWRGPASPIRSGVRGRRRPRWRQDRWWGGFRAEWSLVKGPSGPEASWQTLAARR